MSQKEHSRIFFSQRKPSGHVSVREKNKLCFELMGFTAFETRKMQSLKQLSFYSHFCKNYVCSQFVTSWIVWKLYLSYNIKNCKVLHYTLWPDRDILYFVVSFLYSRQLKI